MLITPWMIVHRLLATLAAAAVIYWLVDYIGIDNLRFAFRRHNGYRLIGSLPVIVLAGWLLVLFSNVLGGETASGSGGTGWLWALLGWFFIVLLPLVVWVAAQ